MRQWILARRLSLCGGCGADIHVGAPAQVVRLPGVSRDRLRCETCADERFTPDKIPADTDPVWRPPARRPPMVPIVVLMEDWKARQSGEDEP